MSLAVFLFAHQDDEFGALRVIDAAVQRGARVLAIYLTSGAQPGQSTTRRDRESTNVLGQLGVLASDIHFLGRALAIPDGKLHEHLDTAWSGIENVIDRVGRPERLYVLAWEGGHQDHDAAHILGVAAAARYGRVDHCWQFSLYHGAGLPAMLFRVLAPLKENGPLVSEHIQWRDRLRYLRLCLAYPSQVSTWIGIFPFVTWRYLTRGQQQLQPVRPMRILEEPHSGKALYERRRFCTRAEFRRATQPFVDHLTRSFPRLFT